MKVPPRKFDLDGMLSSDEASEWLQVEKRSLMRMSKGRKPTLPGFWLGDKTVRFSPRIVIAHLAHRAGVEPSVIEAALRDRRGGSEIELGLPN